MARAATLRDVAKLARCALATSALLILLLPGLVAYLFVLSVAISHRLSSPPPRGTTPPDARPSAGCGRPAEVPTGQAVYRTLVVDGLEREYLLWLPASYEPSRPYPLMISFHGATSSSVLQMMQDQLHCLADAAPYIVAWPEGHYRDSSHGYSSWNVPGATARGDSPEQGAPCMIDPTTGNWGSVDHPEYVSFASCEYNGTVGRASTPCFSAACVDDARFGEALLDALEATLCVDAGRVSLHGHSMGGLMALSLASSPPLNGRVAAVAASAASPFGGYNRVPSPRPVPLLKIDAARDEVIPAGADLSIGGSLGALGSAVGEDAWLYTPSVEVTRAWAAAFDAGVDAGAGGAGGVGGVGGGGAAAGRVPAGAGVPTVLDGFRSFRCEAREGWSSVVACAGDWAHAFALSAPLDAPLPGPALPAILVDFASRFVRLQNGDLAPPARPAPIAGDSAVAVPAGVARAAAAPIGASLVGLDGCAAFGPARAAAMLSPGVLGELARRYPAAGAALILLVGLGAVEAVALVLLLGGALLRARRRRRRAVPPSLASRLSMQ